MACPRTVLAALAAAALLAALAPGTAAAAAAAAATRFELPDPTSDLPVVRFSRGQRLEELPGRDLLAPQGRRTTLNITLTPATLVVRLASRHVRASAAGWRSMPTAHPPAPPRLPLHPALQAYNGSHGLQFTNGMYRWAGGQVVGTALACGGALGLQLCWQRRRRRGGNLARAQPQPITGQTPPGWPLPPGALSCAPPWRRRRRRRCCMRRDGDSGETHLFGPTLRLRAGDQYVILLANNMCAAAPAAAAARVGGAASARGGSARERAQPARAAAAAAALGC